MRWFDVDVRIAGTGRRPASRTGLSGAQEELVEALRRHGGVLHRWSGGCWTYWECSADDVWPEGEPVPRWWPTGTVNSLLRKGHVVADELTSWGTPGRVRLVEARA